MIVVTRPHEPAHRGSPTMPYRVPDHIARYVLDRRTETRWSGIIDRWSSYRLRLVPISPALATDRYRPPV
jgi:hypothetical protein